MAGQKLAHAMKFRVAADEHVFAEGLQNVRAGQKLAVRHFAAAGEEVVHGDFEDLEVTGRGVAKISREGRLTARDHVEIELCDGIKAAAFEKDGLFEEDVARLPDFAIRAEQGGIREAKAHEFERDEAILKLRRGKGEAAEVDHIHLDAFTAEIIEQAGEEIVERVAKMEGGEDEIHAEDAERLALPHVAVIEEANVDLDVAGGATGRALKAQTEPSVAFLRRIVVGARADGVGEGEKVRVGAALGL